MAVASQRHRLRIEDYHKMAGAGVFREDERVELIEGEVFDMSPIGSLHAGTLTRLVALLAKQVGESTLIHPQNPVRLGDASEPQPDLTLLRYRSDFYTHSHPAADDILLLIELADASLAYDKGVKLPLYARHGIPETWLIDLIGLKMEVYRQPGPRGYKEILLPDAMETVTPTLIPAVGLRLHDLLI